MKFIIRFLIVISTVISSVAFSAEEAPLVYVTTDALQIALRNDSGKPEVFYWGNLQRDRMMVPITKSDAGVAVLEIRGGEAARVDRSALSSFLTRLIPVPTGKSKATVTIETNYSFDLWSEARHSGNAANDFPFASVFFGDGKKVCAEIPFPTVAIPTSWNEATKTFEVPPGAKFLGLTLTAPGGATAKIRNINVFFE